MSELSNLIRTARINLNLTPDDAAHKCGVSRETFYRLDRGQLIRFSFLRKVIDGLKLPDQQKLEIIAAYLRDHIGPEMTEKLWIEPKNSSPKFKETESENQAAKAATTFARLNPSERAVILKAMASPHIIQAIAGIVTAFDKLTQPPKK